MSRRKFTTTFMCDIYVRSELFLIELDRLIFPVLTSPRFCTYIARVVPFFIIFSISSEWNLHYLVCSFIAPYLIFDSELSRFTSFLVMCSFPPLTPPRTGLCFPILSTEMRYHIRIVVPIVLPAGRPISISAVKTLRGVWRIFPMVSHRKKFLRRCSPLLVCVLIIPWHLISIPRQAQWILQSSAAPRGCTFRNVLQLKFDFPRQ